MNTRSRDVRELLGMHTVGARILLGIYTASLIVVTIGIQEDLAAAWPTVGSLLILVAASVALLIGPGDPIPWPATIAMIAAGPLASALTLAVLPVPVALPLQLWTHGGATTIYCFMCLRGRLGSAWVGLAATAAALAGELGEFFDRGIHQCPHHLLHKTLSELLDGRFDVRHVRFMVNQIG